MSDFNPNYRNESEVRSKLVVQYLLPKLGYTQPDWYQEVALGTIRLDFLVFAAQVLPYSRELNYPFSLVIETKSPSQSLDKHIRRLQQYLTSLYVHYGLLTNGKDLRIYHRDNNNFKMVFQCTGQEIPDKIDEIKSIVGRESIKSRQSIKEKIVQGKPKDMKVIAIYHNKGGVGKTTVSVNLAAALRRKGYNVLLIDLDSQANSTFATGLIKFQFEENDDLRDNNVFHILNSGDFDFIKDVARQSNFFNTPEIDVIPSHVKLIEGQHQLNQVTASKTRLLKKLKQEETTYDFVIIDTPPSRDIYAQVAIIAANYLIVPSDLKPFANQGLLSVRNFLAEIDEFRESLGKDPIKVLGVLPSKISTNQKSFISTFSKYRESIINHYKFPVMDSIIFDRIALSTCLNQNIIVGDLEIPDPKSIFDYADKISSANQSAQEFEGLATEVLDKIMEKV